MASRINLSRRLPVKTIGSGSPAKPLFPVAEPCVSSAAGTHRAMECPDPEVSRGPSAADCQPWYQRPPELQRIVNQDATSPAGAGMSLMRNGVAGRTTSGATPRPRLLGRGRVDQPDDLFADRRYRTRQANEKGNAHSGSPSQPWIASHSAKRRCLPEFRCLLIRMDAFGRCRPVRGPHRIPLPKQPQGQVPASRRAQLPSPTFASS